MVSYMGRKDLSLVQKIDTNVLLNEYLNNKDKMHYANLYYQPSHTDFTYVDLISASQKNISKGVGYVLSHELSTDIKIETYSYPRLMSILSEFAVKEKSFLSRTLLTSLKNESRYYPHVDSGFFYVLHDRFHLVIFSEGSSMICGGFEQVFYTGDMFYINNKIVHSGKSVNTDSERIHVFFDLLSKNPFVLVKKYVLWLFIFRNLEKKVSLLNGLKGISYLMEAICLSLFTYRKRHNTHFGEAVNFK